MTENNVLIYKKVSNLVKINILVSFKEAIRTTKINFFYKRVL